MPFRLFAHLLALSPLVIALGQTGCTMFQDRVIAPNPMVSPTADFETTWNATVRVLAEYFDGIEENRLAGQIRTEPKIGATIFEPWAGDSVGLYQRVEASMQTIRRFAIARVEPTPDGTFAVRIEVYKELEDLPKPERQTGGRAAFVEPFPVTPVRDIVGPVALPVGWIPRGQDHELEQEILHRINKKILQP